MKKDIEWLKEEIGDLPTTSAEFINDGLNYIDSAIPVTSVYDLIKQLYEPEVKQMKELESYNDDLIRYNSQLRNELSELDHYNDELIRDNNQLRNALDNQEVLSQEWIDEHATVVTYNGLTDPAGIVYVDDLENLIVPKREVLSQEWIDDNKVARINNVRKMTTSDVVTVEKLQNLLVPKQDLPVIPKYVAVWVETASKFHSISWLLNYRNIKEWSHELTLWCFESGSDDNLHKLARAWLDGYEVEEEPLYHALVKGHELVLDSYENWALYRGTRSPLYISYKYSFDDKFVVKMSKEDWNELGINDSNADFVRVEE